MTNERGVNSNEEKGERLQGVGRGEERGYREVTGKEGTEGCKLTPSCEGALRRNPLSSEPKNFVSAGKKHFFLHLTTGQ